MARSSSDPEKDQLAELAQQIDFARQEFAFFLAQADSPVSRDAWILALTTIVKERGIEPVEFKPEKPIENLLSPLAQICEDLPLSSPICIFVTGLELSVLTGEPNPPLLAHLNLARELYRQRIPHPIVFWLPDDAITILARQAPDFWAWRSGVFEFTGPPQMEEKAGTRPGMEKELHQEKTRLQDELRLLAAFLAPFLPYLLKGGKRASRAAFEKAGEIFAEDAWEKADKIWGILRPRVGARPAAQEAAQDVASAMERGIKDEDALAALRQQLKKILAEDPDLTTEAGMIVGQIGNLSYSERNMVIGRDVADSALITGDGNRVIQANTYMEVEGNVYSGAPPRDSQEALRFYRKVLAQTTSSLPLRGIDLGASDPTTAQKPIGLANVYVELNTRSTREESRQAGKSEEKAGAFGAIAEPRRLSALEALIQNRHIVLLGDPGSGKSTFVNYLANCLATQTLKGLKGWPKAEADILPIIVVLRDFARNLPQKLPQNAEPRHLWSFIADRLRAQNLTQATEPIRETLEKGQAMVLLDGLDEVPSTEQRAFVRDAVKAFIERYPDNRYIVTCRVLSYQPPKSKKEPDLRLATLPEYELSSFSEEQVNRFIELWYKELAGIGVVSKEEAPALTQRLRTAIQRPELSRLAANPLLLTVMALVHTHKGRLPEARALLYEETVDILLWRWEQVRGMTSQLSRLLLEAGCTDIDLKRALWQVAYEAHAQIGAEDNEEKLAGIREFRLQQALAVLNKNDRNWAMQIVETMKLRAGLLVEREPGIFTFPHRSFQEYLAGAFLASQGNFAARATELAASGSLWREVILWAVGRLVYLSGDFDKPLALVGELCPSGTPGKNLDWLKAWLAGDALLETGLNRVQDSALGRDLLPRVRSRLVDLLNQGKLTPRERASAGDTLARLGDPRFDAERWHLPKESMLGFVHIPAGDFTMGTKKKDIESLIKKFGGQKEWYEPEVEQHTVKLPEFYLARYPVTVAQFKAFVDDCGYKPRDTDSLQGVPNHPVRYVTWFDAIEYCKWLNEKLKLAAPHQKGRNEAEQNFWNGIQNGKLIVTLPSEAEWEKAARGGEACEFPWAGDFEQNNVNNNMVIGNTSAVGCFPQGRSPYDIHDMAGNVWEWTRSIYEKYPYKPEKKRETLDDEKSARVLRGGAFYNVVRSVRCACRSRYDPLNRYYYLGFRVVVVSPPISLVPHSGS